MTFSVFGKGYRGHRETARAHFEATSGQRETESVGEAMLRMTAMIAADHGSYNQGKQIYAPEDSGGEGEGEFPCVSISIKERYTEVSRILRHYYLAPYGMFETLANANGEYVRNRAIELRSGTRSGDISMRCIYVQEARCYDDHIGWRYGNALMHLKSSIEQAIGGEFESPQYVVRRSSRIRRDFSTRNSLSSESLAQDLEEAAYMWGNSKRHVDMWGGVPVASWGDMSGANLSAGKMEAGPK